MVVGYRCGAWWDHRDDLHYIGVESGKGCTLVIGTVSSNISSNQSSFPALERSSIKCQIITGTKPLVLSFLVSRISSVARVSGTGYPRRAAHVLGVRARKAPAVDLLLLIGLFPLPLSRRVYVLLCPSFCALHEPAFPCYFHSVWLSLSSCICTTRILILTDSDF